MTAPTIRRAPNHLFPGRRPDETEYRARVAGMLLGLEADLAAMERRLAALEREARANGNGERG